MATLNLADTFATFLALIGPQKVLLSFARLARTLDSRSVRNVAIASSAAATGIIVTCELTAPWIVSFFHISAPALELSAGVVFFVYAVGLVFGLHPDSIDEPPRTLPDSGTSGADTVHPVASGFREMMLPYVVSPLAVAAALAASVSAASWAYRWTVAGAFALVALLNMACAMLFANWLGRMHDVVLEVLSRLLGTLLAAVGVQLFLLGLTGLGVLHSPATHLACSRCLRARSVTVSRR